ncbi:recombinase, partial [Salmonella enterica subsp. enterica serovar Enteritidis]|nr:recombinase [Salmonella enterica subsp. enterica serovar Enteritidis]
VRQIESWMITPVPAAQILRILPS